MARRPFRSMFLRHNHRAAGTFLGWILLFLDVHMNEVGKQMNTAFCSVMFCIEMYILGIV